MKTSLAVLALAAVGSYAAPTSKFTVTDVHILQYALTLEHLEDTFYREALEKFSNQMDADTLKNIKRVASDERSHVAFLTKALGSQAVPACTYNFHMTDVKSFLATASVLEGVGVSAYLGAAGDIMNKAYLGAAGSILTVEARHAAFIRNRVGKPAFPAPYDVPQDYRQVFTLASAFITGCSYSTGLQAFPMLTVGPATSYYVGSKISLTMGSGAPAHASGKHWMAAFTAPGKGYAFSPVTYSGGKWHTTIPQGTMGQTYVAIVNGDSVSDDTTVAGPAIIEVQTQD